VGVLDAVRNALPGISTAIGQGFAGYGQDDQIKVKEALAQAKAIQDADNARVLNRVRLAGIDPTIQGSIAGARAQAEVQPHITEAGGKAQAEVQPHIAEAAGKVLAETPGLVERAKEMTPIKQDADIATHRANRLTDVANPENKFIPVVTTAADQSQRVSSFDTHTGGVTEGAVEAKAPAGGGAGGSVRGLGQGGVFGAGSGLGAVKEMAAANPNLKKFEQGFLSDMPTSDLGALDRFRQKLAGDLQTHGFISAGTATEAERELAAQNPALVVYGRNLKQWIVADLNLSRGATDERQRLDMAVSGLGVPLSSMPPAQRADYINQIWEARDARLAGLQTAAAAAQKMLDRVSGTTGTPSPTPGAGPPSFEEWLKTKGH
jgi:hypothetical protein